MDRRFRREFTSVDGLNPESRVKKAGNASVLYPTVVTPSVSKTSNVLPISKIDLTPAQMTTVFFALESSVKSLEISNVVSASRWTPPMPPVTKTGIFNMSATNNVAETVVAPSFSRLNEGSGREDLPILARCHVWRP